MTDKGWSAFIQVAQWVLRVSLNKKKYCQFLIQGKEMAPLKGNVKNETKKLSGNDNRVLGMENDKRDKKAPPEETGQESILDLLRWPLLFKYTVINTLLW